MPDINRIGLAAHRNPLDKGDQRQSSWEGCEKVDPEKAASEERINKHYQSMREASGVTGEDKSGVSDDVAKRLDDIVFGNATFLCIPEPLTDAEATLLFDAVSYRGLNIYCPVELPSKGLVACRTESEPWSGPFEPGQMLVLPRARMIFEIVATPSGGMEYVRVY